MAAVNSIKDLIKKISNSDNGTFKRLSSIKNGIENHLSEIRHATSLESLYYHYGNINGILLTLYSTGYISGEEQYSMISELKNLRSERSEYIIYHMPECTKEGD